MAKRLTNEEFLNRLNDYTNNSVELLTEYKNKKTKVLIKCKKCGRFYKDHIYNKNNLILSKHHSNI